MGEVVSRSNGLPMVNSIAKVKCYVADCYGRCWGSRGSLG
jgi:hypothetical protein